MKFFAKLTRWVAEFELALAEYRRQRIDHELAYGSVFDIEELIIRKSNIACEIRRIKQEISACDAVLIGEIV